MSSTTAALKRKAGMNARADKATKVYKDLYDKKVLERLWRAIFTRYQDSKRTKGSCWGPRITDVLAEMAGKTRWEVADQNGAMQPLDNEGVKQALQRAWAAAEKGEATYIAVPNAGAEGGAVVLVRHKEEVLVLDFESKGSVQVATVGTKWLDDDGKGASIEDPLLVAEVEKAFKAQIAHTAKVNGKEYMFAPRSVSVTFCLMEGGQAPVVARRKERAELFGTRPPVVLTEQLVAAVKNAKNLKHSAEVMEMPHGKAVVLVERAVPEMRVRILNLYGKDKHAAVTRHGAERTKLFVIRDENLNESIGGCAASRIDVPITDPDGSNARTMKLSEVLKQIGKLAKHAGMDENVDLSDPSDEAENVTVRFQVAFVPCDEEGQDVNEIVYDYQTQNDMQPSTLYILGSPFGSSFSTSTAGRRSVTPEVYDAATKTLNSVRMRIKPTHKSVEDMETFTAAESAALVAKGCGGKVRQGPKGIPQVPGMSFLVQVPVDAEPPPPPPAPEGQYRSLSGGGGGEAAYRSLSTVPDGVASAASISLGEYAGRADGVKNGKLKRSLEGNITVTMTAFIAVSPPAAADRSLVPGEYNISEADLLAAGKKLDEWCNIVNSKKLFDTDFCAPNEGATSEAAVLAELAKKTHENVATGAPFAFPAMPVFTAPTPMEVSS